MKQETAIQIHPLATFAAQLRWDDVPEPVQRKAEDLWVDWFGSVLAGQNARPVHSIARFALSQGPASGPCEVIGQSTTTSPMMAALANAAAAHVAEQDDVHNGSVFHPAAVVFPPALAVAQSLGASGAQLMAACVAGYEVGIRVGEFLGRSHYRIFHTTATAGTLSAAAAVGHLEDHLQCRRDPALAGPQDDPALFVGRGIGGMHSGLRRRRGRLGFRHQRRRAAALQLAGTQQGHVRAALL